METVYRSSMDMMVHNHSRILHIFRLVVIIGIMYQMMGCEFRFREMESVYLKK